MAFYTILEVIYRNLGTKQYCFFLMVPAGAGRAFLYSIILHIIRGMGESINHVVSTGVAPPVLVRGRTDHSAFMTSLLLNASLHNFWDIPKSRKCINNSISILNYICKTAPDFLIHNL